MASQDIIAEHAELEAGGQRVEKATDVRLRVLTALEVEAELSGLDLQNISSPSEPARLNIRKATLQ